MSKKQARIENWFIGPNDQLFGTVYDHSEIRDGEMVQTSRVVSYDKANNVAYTKNNEYILGKPVGDSEDGKK
jgi:hypothetical protein